MGYPIVSIMTTHAQKYTVTGMTCSGCASKVEKVLSSVPGVSQVTIDLDQRAADITMSQPVSFATLRQALKPYPSYQISENGHITADQISTGFWQDSSVWQRASFNTLNCLIGCSIGDFTMILFLQRFYPGTSMAIQMILATLAGLITSVALETVLLKSREGFNWGQSFQTALSMSFMSMVAMELAMNATDFMITGGKAAFENPMYWVALLVAMVAGFLVPLPYNYYKLKKFNKACH